MCPAPGLGLGLGCSGTDLCVLPQAGGGGAAVRAPAGGVSRGVRAAGRPGRPPPTPGQRRAGGHRLAARAGRVSQQRADLLPHLPLPHAFISLACPQMSRVQTFSTAKIRFLPECSGLIYLHSVHP